MNSLTTIGMKDLYMNMNIRITLSLILIALTVQSTHTASHAENAKTVGKAAWHLTQVGAAGFILYGAYHERKLKEMATVGLIAAPPLYNGINGLKSLFCNGVNGLKPHIEQTQNNMKDNAKKAGKIALYLAQTGFGSVVPIVTAYAMKIHIRDNARHAPLTPDVASAIIAVNIAACAALQNGVTGLKKETLPLIKQIKEKFSKKTIKGTELPAT